MSEHQVLEVVLSGGQQGDAPVGETLLAEVLSYEEIKAVSGDRAYDSDAIRALIAAAGKEVVIPPRCNRRQPATYDKEKYKQRNRAERLFGKLKGYRGVATRYDKLATRFLGSMLAALLAVSLRCIVNTAWQRAQALLCGALFAPASHVLTGTLRVLGLAADRRFQNYHRRLNRARWSARTAAGILLRMLVAAFVPTGPRILGLDETVERRRGPKITARAIYREAARSSRECFQKTSGLRWLSRHLLAPVRWAKRVWALPFLTALCPSARYAPYVTRGRRHKSFMERARGLIGQVRRWLPGRALTVVADSGYAAIGLLAWCQCLPAPVTLITHAALYEPAPARPTVQRGRSRRKGQRLPTLAKRLTEADTTWNQVRVHWYGGTWRWLEVATDTAV